MANRATSIDLLRGFALVMMIFSGMIPFGDALPVWMYHAQVPPPLHQFNPNIAGLTWVDLVFPFFLFSMGAAVPFALPVKLATHGFGRTFGELLRRTIRLLFIAIVGWNFHPLRLPTLGWWASIAGILTYAGLFISFFTFPNITKQQKLIKNIVSIVLLVGIFVWLKMSGKEINPSVNDAILRVLANVYFVGSLIWIFTNGLWFLRMSVYLFFICFYLGSLEKGSWVENLWLVHDTFNLVSPMLLKYLLIFIPGTIVGDVLVMKFTTISSNDTSNDEKDALFPADASSARTSTDVAEPYVAPLSYQRGAAIVYVIVALATTVLTLWATLSRQMEIGLCVSVGLGFIAFVSVFFLGTALSDEELLSKPISKEQLIKIQFVVMGFALLVMGYFLDPFQNGVKKDHATLSYFFMTSGLATLWILAFHHFYSNSWIARLLKPIERVGQNALMAYLMAGFLIVPIMNLTHLSDFFIAPSPDTIAVYGVLKAVLITVFVIILTAFLSKKRVFWKI